MTGEQRPPGVGRLGAAVADLVVPVECAGCGRPRTRWCARCADHLTGAPRAVRTRADIAVPVWSLAGYGGPAGHAVTAFKDRGRVDMARPLGAALAAGLDALCAAGELPEPEERPIVLVPVPASAGARRRRGLDHVRLLADAAAADLSASVPAWPVAVAPLLGIRGTVRDSTGLSAAARRDNLRGRVHRRGAGVGLVASRGAPATTAELLGGGATVVVVDDVVTTGATLAECLDVLSAGGLGVDGAVVIVAA